MKPSFEANEFCNPKGSLKQRNSVISKHFLGFTLLYPAYGPEELANVINLATLSATKGQGITRQTLSSDSGMKYDKVDLEMVPLACSADHYRC
jgi:hypothetical protein